MDKIHSMASFFEKKFKIICYNYMRTQKRRITMAFKIDKQTAQQLIEANKKFLGEKAYNEILNNPMDYSYNWLNKLEAIANGTDEN